MLSNAYFLAKIRFDTAENEPAKNLQNLPILLNLAPNPNPRGHEPCLRVDPPRRRLRGARRARAQPYQAVHPAGVRGVEASRGSLVILPHAYLVVYQLNRYIRFFDPKVHHHDQLRFHNKL